MNQVFIFRHLVIRILLMWLFAAGITHAQTYSVDHFVLSGGGGTSTNGAFGLTGVIGQSAAVGRLAGGSYTLDPSFWNVVVALETSKGPIFLTIAQTGDKVAISWPAAAGFALQFTSNLIAPIAWQPVNEAPVLVGPNNILTLTVSEGNKFYRLQRGMQ